jgi:hypothetical protein
MGQAHENQKQGQLAQSGVAESGGEAQNIGDLFQCVQQAKDGAEGGFGQRCMIELPAEGATEGFDARRIPVGEIGQRAILDFAVLAVGLPKEDSGGRLAIGYGGDVHVD